MPTNRLEAFSDGVIAILITIMVLDLKVPAGTDLAALRPVLPTALAYLLSFIFLGIYWNNHHHLIQAVDRINGSVLWPNLHLLFWLSLVPFATSWLGRSPGAAGPTALYGIVLLGAALAFTILQRTVISVDGPSSRLAQMVGDDGKGLASLAAYAAAIPLAFVSHWIADALYILVALIWLVPDRRFEAALRTRR